MIGSVGDRVAVCDKNSKNYGRTGIIIYVLDSVQELYHVEFNHEDSDMLSGEQLQLMVGGASNE